MELNLEPVKVDLQIETPSLERGAFYSLCFITDNDEAPRTLKVTRLQDLLDNRYSRLDLAYNFCVGVFAQQGIDAVQIRAKRSGETYQEAYLADINDGYYYIVLQTKDIDKVNSFNRFLASTGDLKLQFYSSNKSNITEARESKILVSYYQDYELGDDVVPVTSPDHYLNVAYGGNTDGGDTGGGGGDWNIDCTPTSVLKQLEYGDSYVTVSREGGTPTVLLPVSTESEEDIENYFNNFFMLLYLSKDGQSLAFVDTLMMDEDALYSNETSNEGEGFRHAHSGISVSGDVFMKYGGYDPSDIFNSDITRDVAFNLIDSIAPNPDMQANLKIVPEVNTIQIYPTDGAPTEKDIYYKFGGNESGEPITIYSCAKAAI